MELDVKQFLLLNGFLIAVIAISFFLRRKDRQQPTRLDMRAGNAPPRSSSKEMIVVKDTSDRSQSLNVIFNYNGHSWDAYEALGIPAGASTSMVEAAYKKAIDEVGSDSREFIETAYRSIINR